LSAESYSHDDKFVEATVRRWAANDGLVGWERLADFRGEAVRHTANVYTQGHHMLGYVSTRFGRARRNHRLRAMAQGAALDDATSGELGVSFEQLDKDWRASLKRPPDNAEGT